MTKKTQKTKLTLQPEAGTFIPEKLNENIYQDINSISFPKNFAALMGHYQQETQDHALISYLTRTKAAFQKTNLLLR